VQIALIEEDARARFVLAEALRHSGYDIEEAAPLLFEEVSRSSCG
jgi:DNA-binding response OmpR family regulator